MSKTFLSNVIYMKGLASHFKRYMERGTELYNRYLRGDNKALEQLVIKNGDTAYVCTAKGYTYPVDPVFAFDLSDIDNITYTDTGTIPGYSLSLNNFAFDTLLGIGYGDESMTLKIELYAQTDNNVKSVAKYEESQATFSTEYKAHLIDAENGIIGLGIYSRTLNENYERPTRYAIFRYDGHTIVEIASIDMKSSLLDNMRAVVIDGCVYVIEEDGFRTANDIKVVKLD